jgi:hypothetical protein
MGMYI